MQVKPVPDGYYSVTPYLIVDDGNAAVEFYKNAFDATELMKIGTPDGKVGHAEIKIGNAPVMLADEYPDMGFRSPKTIGGAGVSMLIYTENVDQMFEQAIANGAKVISEVKNQFYGDRTGTLEDPFGHVWTIATHIEDLSEDEMMKRSEQQLKEQGPEGA